MGVAPVAAEPAADLELVQQPLGLPARDELLDYDGSWHLKGRRFGGFVGVGPPVWRFDRRFRASSTSPN